MFTQLLAYSQGGVNSPGLYDYTVSDCFLSENYSGVFKPDTVAPQNQMKGTRIWRTISLDNPQNKELLNTNKNCTEVGLLEIIKFGLLVKQLNAFGSDNFALAYKTRMSEKQVLNALTYNDTSVVLSFDADGKETRLQTKTTRYLMGDDIKSYLLLEDWVINNKSGELEKYIIGWAPLIYRASEDKTVPLFWLYFPEWKELLASFEAKNFYSHSRITFFDVFEKRYFISQINKESNVFDRSVKDSRKGRDINMENELIKEKLRNSESDLFQH
ncbi:MAG: hypothetical protein IT236_14550 [Bacteroidia bacterium]|nr:hypothetical protein [Bacteroidia bacterium]